MTEPTFDADGYPTDETIAAIEKWPDVAGCLDFCRAAWHGAEGVRETVTAGESAVIHATPTGRYVRFATGGWSGNEQIIAALRRNRVVSLMAWQLSARGGLHIFQYPTPKGDG